MAKYHIHFSVTKNRHNVKCIEDDNDGEIENLIQET